jgi:hypothetical protein
VSGFQRGYCALAKQDGERVLRNGCGRGVGWINGNGDGYDEADKSGWACTRELPGVRRAFGNNLVECKGPRIRIYSLDCWGFVHTVPDF